MPVSSTFKPVSAYNRCWVQNLFIVQISNWQRRDRTKCCLMGREPIRPNTYTRYISDQVQRFSRNLDPVEESSRNTLEIYNWQLDIPAIYTILFTKISAVPSCWWPEVADVCLGLERIYGYSELRYRGWRTWIYGNIATRRWKTRTTARMIYRRLFPGLSSRIVDSPERFAV